MKVKLDRLTAELRELAIDEGMDLFGVAPVERFEETPQDGHPTAWLPETKTVVSLGYHMMAGAGDVWGGFHEPHKSVSPYTYYGYGVALWDLARVAYLLACELEDAGFQTALFPPAWSVGAYKRFGPPEGVEVQLEFPRFVPWPDRSAIGGQSRTAIVRPDFCHTYTAIAAGLGELGWNGLCLTPSFGARQRFNSILTDAPLETDPLYYGPPLCRPEACGWACAEECPTGALCREASLTSKIAGRSYMHGDIDWVRCQYGLDGLVRGSGGLHDVTLPKGTVSWSDYAAAVGGLDTDRRASRARLLRNQQRPLLYGDYCERCLHRCPAHLWH